MDETLKTELVRQGTEELQNKDAWFPRDSNGRSFSKDWFYIHLDNGETMLRTWLVFSPVNNAAYCFPCMLFQKAKWKSSFGKSSGFNAWRKLSPRLLEHERSSYHLSAFTIWKELEMRLHKQETIDAAAQLAQQMSFEKWKAILVRILDCILYLARQTLPIRGHSEDLNTDGNCGNFLETFKLLAKYDPVAKQHLHRVQRTDGYIVSYLSPQSQDEFINLLGDHIRTVIFQNIIKAKYFAIMFDSTPDISHTDQMSQVIRYVQIEDSGVHVTESFIDFIQLYRKSADVITKQICDKLQADGLKLEHCYGQGYDNAATMAGHISGVQKRILDMNPKAISTHRWDILKKHVPIRVKRSCNTRWSSTHEAVCVLAEHTEKIIDALEALRDGPEETSETGERRVGRRKKMDGENSCDAGLTLIQETSREQLEAIDQLQAEIKKRTTQMNTLHQRFAFLQIQTLLDTKKDDFIKKQIQHTCAQYPELNAASMLTEITRLRDHIILYKEVNPDEQVANWSALDLLRWVYKWKLQESLTNFVVTLRIFLTITVSTASCERSFSKLKRIKTYQRSTMSQERLSNLAILSIERDFNVDFNSVVEKFALIKSRRI
ncbi:zinc finger MYM-type 1-like [Pelobates cultripes]|uniref:Zinc finger MYM-type 1-like n=1 Tax=Pelobates cultripes TaxID=61616 RepID=A0AAD1RG15_PELCU|nr:zinc finger MYM-type 1-like [Pelobates cultripes]